VGRRAGGGRREKVRAKVPRIGDHSPRLLLDESHFLSPALMGIEDDTAEGVGARRLREEYNSG
jgi:hypothetical protein